MKSVPRVAHSKPLISLASYTHVFNRSWLPLKSYQQLCCKSPWTLIKILASPLAPPLYLRTFLPCSHSHTYTAWNAYHISPKRIHSLGKHVVVAAVVFVLGPWYLETTTTTTAAVEFPRIPFCRKAATASRAPFTDTRQQSSLGR